MELTTEQADELIVNTALAAMYHNDDYAALDESAGLHAAVTAALEPLVDVEITADERESLRVLCARAIADPTAWRLTFLDTVLAATWRAAMWGKLAGHDIDDPAFLHPTRPMSAIGG